MTDTDPLDRLTVLRALADEVSPPPAADVRRRGDRRRRRARAGMVAAAVVAVVAVAVPVTVLGTGDDSRPQPAGPTRTGPSATEGVLSEALLADPADLPELSPEVSAGAWTGTPLGTAPVLACQGAALRSLGAEEQLTHAYQAPGGSGQRYPLGVITVGVLQFDDEEAANTAYDTVQGWLRDCPATETGAETHEVQPLAPVGPGAVPAVERAARSLVQYSAPQVCPDGGCDAAWFDAQVVAQAGTRLVLLSHAEIAGPCPPGPGTSCEGDAALAPWLERVDATTAAVVGQAVSDLG